MKKKTNTNMTNMKGTITKNIFFTLLFLTISSMAIAGNKTVKIKTSAICDMCKNRLELVVNNIDGVKKSMLNLKTGIILVKYNTSKLSVTDIRTVISETGYDADDIPANAKAYAVLPGCCKKGSSCDVKK